MRIKRKLLVTCKLAGFILMRSNAIFLLKKSLIKTCLHAFGAGEFI